MTPKPPHGFRRGGGLRSPSPTPKFGGKPKSQRGVGQNPCTPTPGVSPTPEPQHVGGVPRSGEGGGGATTPSPVFRAGFVPKMTLVTLTAGPGGPAAPVSPSLPGRPCGGDPPPTSSAPSRASVSPPGGCFRRRSPQERFWGGGGSKTNSPAAPGHRAALFRQLFQAHPKREEWGVVMGGAWSLQPHFFGGQKTPENAPKLTLAPLGPGKPITPGCPRAP